VEQRIIPLRFKLVVLILLIITGTLLASGLIFLIAHFIGININTKADLFSVTENPEYTGYIKFLVGFNHLIVFVLVPLVYLKIFYSGRIVSFLGKRKFNPGLFFWGAAMLYCAYPLMGYLAFLSEKVAWPQWMTEMEKSSIEALSGLLLMNQPIDLMINILIVAILPGIGEELLFRGILQSETEKKLRNAFAAIMITSILFSAFHFQVTGFLPKMIIGAICGYIYYVSRDIRMPILLHFINNGMATAALYLSGTDLTQGIAENEKEISLLTGLISLTLSGMAGYYIFKTYNNLNNEQEQHT
jgi:uncharacterized protein